MVFGKITEGTRPAAALWFGAEQFGFCQVKEKEQLLQQLKEEIEREENLYKQEEQLTLCQVSPQVFLSTITVSQSGPDLSSFCFRLSD